jgi:RNA 3'-terminal phosphate cyclase (ATP)
MIEIDGSFGEGGGQILRTSLALSAITGKPFRIYNIRANRDKPGLRRQHLTAVRAAAEICGGRVSGDAVGSAELTFSPGPIAPGEYTFDIGTAGSTTLVLQAVLPPLLVANGPSRLTLVGGTHNPNCPPYNFLAKSFLPLIERMGPGVESTLERPGFYPAGGGRFTVAVRPAALRPIQLPDRGPLKRRLGRAVVANLPRSMALRELGVIARTLSFSDDELRAEEAAAIGPGNVVMIEVESEAVTEVFTGFGSRGVRAEDVAREAAGAAKRYLDGNVPVGDCLADQLLLPFAIAGGGSFRTLRPTRHTQTNIEVIRLFLDVRVSLRELGRDEWMIEVNRP